MFHCISVKDILEQESEEGAEGRKTELTRWVVMVELELVQLVVLDER